MGKGLCQSTEQQIVDYDPLLTQPFSDTLVVDTWSFQGKKKKPLVNKKDQMFPLSKVNCTERPHAVLDLQWVYLEVIFL